MTVWQGWRGHAVGHRASALSRAAAAARAQPPSWPRSQGWRCARRSAARRPSAVRAPCSSARPVQHCAPSWGAAGSYTCTAAYRWSRSRMYSSIAAGARCSSANRRPLAATSQADRLVPQNVRPAAAAAQHREHASAGGDERAEYPGTAPRQPRARLPRIRHRRAASSAGGLGGGRAPLPPAPHGATAAATSGRGHPARRLGGLCRAPAAPMVLL